MPISTPKVFANWLHHAEHSCGILHPRASPSRIVHPTTIRSSLAESANWPPSPPHLRRRRHRPPLRPPPEPERPRRRRGHRSQPGPLPNISPPPAPLTNPLPAARSHAGSPASYEPPPCPFLPASRTGEQPNLRIHHRKYHHRRQP